MIAWTLLHRLEAVRGEAFQVRHFDGHGVLTDRRLPMTRLAEPDGGGVKG